MTASTVDGPLIGSLFSGTGMLDVAVQAVFGGTVAWQSEVDPAACTVLAARFPGRPNVGDVQAVDWATVQPVDILCGGFPCTGVSSAGLRQGFADPRSGLWSAYVRAIQELHPQIVVIENVRGLLSTPAGETPPEEDDGPVDPIVAALGGWAVTDPMEETTDAPTDSDVEPGDHPLGDRADGPVRAFGVVLGDLADLGFDATWVCLPASAVGAPHPRWRVVLLATPAADTPGERADADELSEQRGSAEQVSAVAPARGGAGSGRARPAAVDADREPVRDEPVPHPRSGGPAEPGDPGPAAADPGSGGRGRRGDSGPAGQRPSGPGHETPGHAAPTPDPASAENPNLATRGERRIPGPGETPGGRARADAGGSGGTPDPDSFPWGPYAPAIERWEHITGQPCPWPVEPGPRGGRDRLSPWLGEWMMGWPTGWVCDLISADRKPSAGRITRNDALRLAGNGVVPQQIIAGLRWLIPRHFGEDT